MESSAASDVYKRQRMERELIRQHMHEEQKRVQALVEVALASEYKRMIKEATEQGFLIDDEITPS